MVSSKLYVVPVVAACIVQDHKVLMALRTASESPETVGMWEMPGGKVELGEEPPGALAREVYEELGYDCNVNRLLHAQINRYSSNIPYLVLFYHVALKRKCILGEELVTQWWDSEDPSRWATEALPGAYDALLALNEEEK